MIGGGRLNTVGHQLARLAGIAAEAAQVDRRDLPRRDARAWQHWADGSHRGGRAVLNPVRGAQRSPAQRADRPSPARAEPAGDPPPGMTGDERQHEMPASGGGAGAGGKREDGGRGVECQRGRYRGERRDRERVRRRDCQEAPVERPRRAAGGCGRGGRLRFRAKATSPCSAIAASTSPPAARISRT